MEPQPQRLKAKGQHAMRKLIHIAFAILKPALSLSKGPDNPTTQSMPLHEEQQDGIYKAGPR